MSVSAERGPPRCRRSVAQKQRQKGRPANMFELRDLRLRIGELAPPPPPGTPGYETPTAEEDRIERTPLEDLTVLDLALYLDGLGLNIEIIALAPEGSAPAIQEMDETVLYTYYDIGADHRELERGGQMVRNAIARRGKQ